MTKKFLTKPRTVIAFCGGSPVLLFERQGKTLRVFEGAEEFRRGRILNGKKRIVVKEYPAETAAALEESGFLREMQALLRI